MIVVMEIEDVPLAIVVNVPIVESAVLVMDKNNKNTKVAVSSRILKNNFVK